MQKATKLEERSHIRTAHSDHTYHTPTDVHYAREMYNHHPHQAKTQPKCRLTHQTPKTPPKK
jgi:hypothetical protein